MTEAFGNRRGFTLTELLVVVAIIVLLTSIVIPNIAARLTVARMHAAENQILEMEAALAAYVADFGTYPGDVFPTEDINNNGVLDTGEDTGVDVDRDDSPDYGASNNRLDRGDGVVNIDDLEWALRTTAKNGPYMESIPLDPWDEKYVYYAPFSRPTYNSNDPNDNGNKNYLWINPANNDTAAVGSLPARTLCTEDINGNGKLDANEDTGIADYDTVATDVIAGFGSMRAGAGNGILDHGDDDNKNNDIETYIDMASPTIPVPLELGNADISPDGLARNLGYYLYSVGRNRIDESATGYEDINLNSILNDGNGGRPLVTIDGGTFNEDINTNGTLDTGYEDTGADGIPGTKDAGEGDGTHQTAEEFHDGHYNTTYDADDPEETLDHGGDDINSWNSTRPWRENESYGG